MRFVFLILSLLLSSHSFCQEKIDWKFSIEEGLKLGKSENKEVLIYFGEDKCVPCRMVKKYAFLKEDFIQYSRKFIMVKVYDDFDKSKTEKQLYIKKYRDEYDVKAVPTFILSKSDGSKTSFFAYVRKPQDLINLIQEKL